MTSKLKIVALEISHSQTKVISGGDKLLEEMSPYLSKKIFLEIIIPKIAVWHWKNKRVKITSLPKNSFDGKSNLFYLTIAYILRIISTTKILLSQKEKHIIYSSTNVFPDIIPAYIAKIKNPHLFWFGRIHHLIPSPQNRPGNLLVNTFSYITQEISLFCLKRASKIAVLNNNLISPLVKKGFNKSKIIILPAAIEPRNWHYKKTSKEYDAIFLGRLHPSKGINDLIPLWLSVCQKHPNAQLLIAGQGPQKTIERLKKEIQKAGILKNIKIAPTVPQNRVKNLLLSSKIFLFLDHEAGFGIAPLEAMACGLPVVGYDIGILGESFKEGFFKANAYDVNAISKTVSRLLSNSKILNSLSTKAKRESHRHYWADISKYFEYNLPKV